MLLHLDMCSSHMNFGLSGLCEKQNPKQEERQTYLGEAYLSDLYSSQHCREDHLIWQLACPSYLANDLRLLDTVLAVLLSGIRL